MQSDRLGLEWWDWLLMSSRDLKRAGYAPSERISKVGQARALPLRWAHTIGLWGISEPTTIMARARCEDSRQTYDLFKYRHELMSRRTWLATNDVRADSAFAVAGQVMLATFAYTRVRVAQMEHPDLSLGAIASRVVHYPRVRAEERQSLGILPIEMLLYFWAVNLVLEASDVSAKHWIEQIGDEDWMLKHREWLKHGGPEYVGLPARALAKYAGRDEEDD